MAGWVGALLLVSILTLSHGYSFLAAVFDNPITSVTNATNRAEALLAITANLEKLAEVVKQAKEQVSHNCDRKADRENSLVKFKPIATRTIKLDWLFLELRGIVSHFNCQVHATKLASA